MLLKAAVFKVLASSPGEEIELDDLQAAKKLAKDLGCNWKENYHDLVGWAEFLVGLRSDLPACGYTNLAFGAGVIARAGRVYALWRESLRYHKNVASAREMGTVREAVDWFVTHQHDL